MFACMLQHSTLTVVDSKQDSEKAKRKCLHYVDACQEFGIFFPSPYRDPR